MEKERVCTLWVTWHRLPSRRPAEAICRAAAITPPLPRGRGHRAINVVDEAGRFGRGEATDSMSEHGDGRHQHLRKLDWIVDEWSTVRADPAPRLHGHLRSSLRTHALSEWPMQFLQPKIESSRATILTRLNARPENRFRSVAFVLTVSLSARLRTINRCALLLASVAVYTPTLAPCSLELRGSPRSSTRKPAPHRAVQGDVSW